MKLSEFGFIRVASISPALEVSNIPYNTEKIIEASKIASGEGANFIVFPELSITGYSCADLFFQPHLLQSAKVTLISLARETSGMDAVIIVGVPFEYGGEIFNCAAVLYSGKVVGLVPKQYIPNSKEFYEKRWFRSGVDISVEIDLGNGQLVPFSSKSIFATNEREILFGIEVCEDLWAPIPPSSMQALAGAQLIFNLSASNELIGKATYRKELVAQQSARCIAAYVYSSAGAGESSTDLVFSGHCIIAENGIILKESPRFGFEAQIIFADIDVQKLNFDRTNSNSYSDSKCRHHNFNQITLPKVSNNSQAPANLGALRPNVPHPFVPRDLSKRNENCEEIFSIQATGLAKRIKHLGLKKLVIGVSGGLDSTLALLVCKRAFEILNLNSDGIIAVTMPGFGTSSRTKNNAKNLINQLGAELQIISISAAVMQHFKDIGHNPEVFNVTYENAQARERTQVLMDLANMNGALVVGTGDLSESALGWCTFNGDHMSMYHVNSGVPKTLVRYIVEWCAQSQFSGEISQTLRDICETPVSPELLPLDGNGKIEQVTEDLVGPYELHDYFLYAFIRCGYGPKKIFNMAEMAFQDKYDPDVILHWLKIFIKRFFGQQFKRSSMPDGPKVGSIALSPRGDWRMPSDACADLWLSELNKL
jgi:NAD+ synthase (glutamine-hydrolysing)